jgi:hypothetical protein
MNCLDALNYFYDFYVFYDFYDLTNRRINELPNRQMTTALLNSLIKENVIDREPLRG